MKKYLALGLAVVTALSMTMSVCAAESPTSSSSSGSKHSSSSSSSSASTSTSTTAKTAATGTAAIVASTPAAAAVQSVASTSTAAQAAVVAAVQPVQKVVVNGQEVAAKVNVAAVNESATAYVNAVLGAIAPGWNLAQTFAFNVSSVDASVTTVTTAISVPALAGVDVANIRLVAFDATTGQFTVIAPVIAANGTIIVTVPANCVLSVVNM
ncbi:MAG: hypothetical protein PHX08_13350 [Lachnospiraceae bacterium]|nr:hypothetical protein [Lachnospiraceae bacterium]